MNEMEAAKKISLGELPSPYKFGDMTLFAMRMSGSGAAFRNSLNEYVWRDESVTLSPEFIERTGAGVPVTLEHPKVGSLSSKEFGDKVIGSTMLGYVVGSEPWCVARIYDDEAIKLMTDGQMSTSPGVIFKKSDGNIEGEAPDGNTILIEGIPSVLSHLAVCALGTWDVDGTPKGVQNDLLKPTTKQGELGMAEEDKKADAAERHDAEKKLDAIMDAFTKLDARLDSFEKEKKDKARHDAARKDKFGHRKDGEKYDAYKKRHDDDEAGMMDAMRKDGADEKDCMDSAKKARHDAEEEEKRHDKDFEKWAKEEEDEPEHKEDKKRKDASEAEEAEKEKDKFKGVEDSKKDSEEKEKEDSRKDSAMRAENDELRARLDELTKLVKGATGELSGSERDALASAQARADSVLAKLGDRASPPIPGEMSMDYRKRILKRLAPHSPQFKGSSFVGLDANQLAVIEDRVYADASNSADAVHDAMPGMLVPFETRDRAGRTITQYHGDIGAMMAPFISGGQTIRINRSPNKVN